MASGAGLRRFFSIRKLVPGSGDGRAVIGAAVLARAQLGQMHPQIASERARHRRW